MDRNAIATVTTMCRLQMPTCSDLWNTCCYPKMQSLDNVKEWIQKYCNHPQYISYCKNILKYYCGINEKNFDQKIFDYFVTNIDFGLDFDENILIKISVYCSNTYTLQYLIKHGIDINTEDNILVKLAAEYGTIDVLKILIENGANIHANDEYCLRVTADSGSINIFKYLIDHGANIEACESEIAETVP